MARPRAVHDLVKCLETYVGGNVKVSEWPIQCTVASGRETGPRDLSLCLFGTFASLTSTRQRRGDEVRQLFSAKCRLASPFAPSIRLDRKRTTGSPSREFVGESRDTYIRTTKNDKSISKSVTFHIRRSFMLTAFLTDCLLYLSHFILFRLIEDRVKNNTM